METNDRKTGGSKLMAAPTLARKDATAFYDALEIPKKDEKVRMALYISPEIAKQFKKQAIDEGTDFSKLAELVFDAFLKSRQRKK